MICETIEGRLETLDTSGKKVEFVEIPWDEAFKRIHRKFTEEKWESAWGISF